jgi:hypothetical protein
MTENPIVTVIPLGASGKILPRGFIELHKLDSYSNIRDYCEPRTWLIAVSRICKVEPANLDYDDRVKAHVYCETHVGSYVTETYDEVKAMIAEAIG